MTRILPKDEALFMLFSLDVLRRQSKMKYYYAEYGELNVRAYFDFIREFGYHNTHDKKTFQAFINAMADVYLQNPESQEYAIYLRSKLEDDLNI